jgi:hypothetical protein
MSHPPLACLGTHNFDIFDSNDQEECHKDFSQPLHSVDLWWRGGNRTREEFPVGHSSNLNELKSRQISVSVVQLLSSKSKGLDRGGSEKRTERVGCTFLPSCLGDPS